MKSSGFTEETLRSVAGGVIMFANDTELFGTKADCREIQKDLPGQRRYSVK